MQGGMSPDLDVAVYGIIGAVVILGNIKIIIDSNSISAPVIIAQILSFSGLIGLFYMFTEDRFISFDQFHLFDEVWQWPVFILYLLFAVLMVWPLNFCSFQYFNQEFKES